MYTVKYSIIVPVYNVEKVLCRCIESILRQTITDFELILINDGSKDDSGQICDQYAQKDKRIQVIHQQNGGVSKARNAGLDIAKGKYIVFVDSDDYVDNTYLEELEEDELTDWVINGYQIEGYNITQPLERKYFGLETNTDNVEKVLECFEKGLFNYPVSKRYTREKIGEYIRFDENISLGEDTLFNLDYLSKCKKIKVTAGMPYHYIKYSQGTLTTQKTDIRLFEKLEHLNGLIRKRLLASVEINVDKSMAVRMGLLYHNFLIELIHTSDVGYKTIKYLFEQREFRNTIDYADMVYADESNKFRMLLKTKSPQLFWLYLKLIQKRK